jgi:16S rRNA processing protein RimM
VQGTSREFHRVLVGRILKPHGVRGLMCVESYMSRPEAITSVAELEDETGRPIRLSVEGAVHGGLLARIEGVVSRDAAEELSGRQLYTPRAALPEPGEDALYEADLVGLTVLEGNVTRGKVVAVADFGAGPLLEVEPAAGRGTVYVPFRHPTVTEIDLKGGLVRVALPAGLWPEDLGIAK